MEQLGKYQIVKRLAAGGMAEVFLGKQSGLEGFEKTVVIKRLHQTMASRQDLVEMFLNEAKIAARLNHPNCVQIYDLGQADGQYFIAMEYIHGPDMMAVQRVAKKTRLFVPPQIASYIISLALRGLHHAHELKDHATGERLALVHRDVSPHNVLVTYNGDVKLVDFGVAKANTLAAATQAGVLKGKFAYMSPEQCRGDSLDARSDVFAAGILLHELVTRKRLFRRNSDFATMRAVLEDPIPMPSSIAPEVPAALDQVIMRALSRELDTRYASAQEMQLGLEEVIRINNWRVGPTEVGNFITQLFPDQDLVAGSSSSSSVSRQAMSKPKVDGSLLGGLARVPGQKSENEEPAADFSSETRIEAEPVVPQKRASAVQQAPNIAVPPEAQITGELVGTVVEDESSPIAPSSLHSNLGRSSQPNIAPLDIPGDNPNQDLEEDNAATQAGIRPSMFPGSAPPQKPSFGGQPAKAPSIDTFPHFGDDDDHYEVEAATVGNMDPEFVFKKESDIDPAPSMAFSIGEQPLEQSPPAATPLSPLTPSRVGQQPSGQQPAAINAPYSSPGIHASAGPATQRPNPLQLSPQHLAAPIPPAQPQSPYAMPPQQNPQHDQQSHVAQPPLQATPSHPGPQLGVPTQALPALDFEDESLGQKKKNLLPFMIAGLAIVFVALLSVAIILLFSSGSDPGLIKLKTTPPGAAVYIDGKKLFGETPLDIPNVEAKKKHKLTILKAGFHPTQKQNIVVKPGETLKLNYILDAKDNPPSYANLEINSTPTAVIYLNGKRRGKTPTTFKKLLAETKYQVVLKRLGYKEIEMHIELKAGETKMLHKKLVKDKRRRRRRRR